jgi:hypothetical protein
VYVSGAGAEKLKAGEIVPVKVEAAEDYDSMGTLVKEA